MMKIIVAPTAYKHSLGALEAANAIERGLMQAIPDVVVVTMPIADGGNSTLDAWLVNGGERHRVRVHDPLMRPVDAEYGILPDGKTAVIEMALASGIELVTDEERSPLVATTYGTGELLAAALEQGASRLIIGMGGSATVDGGAGALQALGVSLLDADGREIPPGGGQLENIETIDAANLDPRWHDAEIIVASDVENPLLGEIGAAAVFGPQKGATDGDVVLLERNLQHFADVILTQNGTDIRTLVGGGAAGGLSAGLIAFLGGNVMSGIDLLLDYNAFEAQLSQSDLVVTGEGQMDEQTVFGKGPVGVARLAAQYDVPTVAIVGSLNVHDTVLRDAGIQAVLPLVDKPMTLESALSNASTLLERAALRLGYLLMLDRRQS